MEGGGEMEQEIFLYHGSQQIVEFPEIRMARFNKDFYFGFYCTLFPEQAKRWAGRFGKGVVNEYIYVPNRNLKVLSFPDMTEEWLDFIVACRLGGPKPILTISWKAPWQMIRFSTMSRTLRMARFHGRHSGHWQDSRDRRIRSASIR